MAYKNNQIFIKIFDLEITYFEIVKYCYFTFLLGCIVGIVYFLLN